MNQLVGDEKRSLRYYEKDNRANDEYKRGINSDDDEERFQSQKLKDLIAGKRSTLFEKWKGKQYDPDYIRTKMRKHLTNSYFVKFGERDVDGVVCRYKEVWTQNSELHFTEVRNIALDNLSFVSTELEVF
ncbi:hypothetical protein PHMEG_00018090 [Phytophthora megakarya]|uniref:RxLR effector protein n=1 Tax=Phytophthora megakarya TaxID=4795 RepID=A0A225VUP0_9STRA|nr:hypothetical protein PHMEG_00018090 [Phytophthora megakarya]